MNIDDLIKAARVEYGLRFYLMQARSFGFSENDISIGWIDCFLVKSCREQLPKDLLPPIKSFESVVSAIVKP